MPVNSTHPEYDENLVAWSRARDVISGEDAVKSAGIRYLPRLDSQTDEEYAAYKERASFFNATSRTAEGYVGLIFRRPPFLKIPDARSALATALSEFSNDADMLGTPLISYAKNVINEVISVGRAGTLIDWEDEVENRVYACLYAAENILNWRVERINGRNITTMIVLYEPSGGRPVSGRDDDPFITTPREQIRVLRLLPGEKVPDSRKQPYSCVVELWQREEKKSRKDKNDWKLIDTRIPLRLGKPLPLIPFVFHGPRHSQPSIDRLPLGDMVLRCFRWNESVRIT